MLRLHRRLACCLFVVLASSAGPALATDHAFPFDRELMLDTPPMPGTKRVPTLQIDANGAISIELWCARLRGQANVGEDSISIVSGPANPAQCAPDRQSGDEKLLAALVQTTNWRRRGDVIELRGATTLRFHLMTN
jgi:heat shock protein HslJ